MLGFIVSIIVAICLIGFMWEFLVYVWHIISWLFQALIVRGATMLMLTLAGAGIMYEVMGYDRIGIREILLVLGGVGVTALWSLVATIFRCAQSSLLGYGAGLGDCMIDSVIGAIFGIGFSLVAFVLRISQMSSRAPGMETGVSYFIKGAVLSAIIMTYGMIVFMIASRSSRYPTEDLFDTSDHPGNIAAMGPFVDGYGRSSDTGEYWRDINDRT